MFVLALPFEVLDLGTHAIGNTAARCGRILQPMRRDLADVFS
jgi:hypothetical protein